jgi:hypothetical protein
MVSADNGLPLLRVSPPWFIINKEKVCQTIELSVRNKTVYIFTQKQNKK